MTAEQQLERSVLEGKERDELSAIAQAMSLKTTTRTKKADIIDQILHATGVTSGSSNVGIGQRRRRRCRVQWDDTQAVPPFPWPPARPRRRVRRVATRLCRDGITGQSQRTRRPMPPRRRSGPGRDGVDTVTLDRRSSSSRPSWPTAPSVHRPSQNGQQNNHTNNSGGGSNRNNRNNRDNRDNQSQNRQQPDGDVGTGAAVRRRGRERGGQGGELQGGGDRTSPTPVRWSR